MSATRQIIYQPRSPLPEADGFAVVSAPMPAAGPSQVLLGTRYLSVDPYMLRALAGQGRRRFEPGQPMAGRLIGQVERSSDPDFPPGCFVLTEGPWQEHFAAEVSRLEKVTGSTEGEVAAHLGVLGQSGLTAWLGMRHIGRPAAGQLVLVSSAAGAVGGAAGQMARILGARVIGIAGGAAKCEHVVRRLKFDDCLDYRAPDFAERLAGLTPRVNLYFDNVGGEILDAVLAAMADDGHVVICGQISQYGSATAQPISNFGYVLERRLRVTGFGVSQIGELRAQARGELAGWHSSGQLVSDLHVVEGLENAPAALVGLLGNSATGKTVVKL